MVFCLWKHFHQNGIEITWIIKNKTTTGANNLNTM